MIAAIGAGAVFCGLSQQAMAAQTWFVAGVTGSDSNNGTTTLTPRKTLPTDIEITSGDTVFLSETIRSSAGGAAIFSFTKSNLTFIQLPGGTQAIFHGGTLTGTGWVSAGGTQYTKTLATGLTISRMAFKYDASTTSSGHHFGVMRPNALALASGEYDYNSTTGVCLINVPSAPTVAADVMYAAVDTTLGALIFTAGSGNLVSGIHFKFYPSSSGQWGWGVVANPHLSMRVFSCKFWDMGNHSTGTLGGGVCSNAVVDGCTFYSGRFDYTAVVFFQDVVNGNLSGCRLYNSTIHLRRFLGVDGTNATESLAITQGQSAMAQVGAYAHSDSGTPIIDVLVDNLTVLEYEKGTGGAWGCGNTPAASNGWDWNTYAFRVDRSSFSGTGTHVGASTLWNFGTIAYRRCHLDMRNAGPSGQTSSRGMISQNGGGLLLIDSCEIIGDLNDSGEAYGIWAVNAGDDIRLLNTSYQIVNVGSATTGRNMFVWPFANTMYIRARGCAFSADANHANLRLCGADNSTDAAHHDFLDNIYDANITTFSQNSSYDTKTEWKTLDTSAATDASYPSGTMFPTAPTNLALTSASTIWSLRRSTAATVPVPSLNGPSYAGFFGAYQYSAVAGTIPGGSTAGMVGVSSGQAGNPRTRRRTRA